MKIRLNRLQIMALIVGGIIGASNMLSATLVLAQNGHFVLGVLILGCVPSSLLLTMALVAVLMRDDE